MSDLLEKQTNIEVLKKEIETHQLTGFFQKPATQRTEGINFLYDTKEVKKVLDKE